MTAFVEIIMNQHNIIVKHNHSMEKEKCTFCDTLIQQISQIKIFKCNHWLCDSCYQRFYNPLKINIGQCLFCKQIVTLKDKYPKIPFPIKPLQHLQTKQPGLVVKSKCCCIDKLITEQYGLGWFDLVQILGGCQFCPSCHTLLKPISLILNNCRYRFQGAHFDEKGKVTKLMNPMKKAKKQIHIMRKPAQGPDYQIFERSLNWLEMKMICQ